MVFHVVFSAIGVLAGVYLSYLIGRIALSIVFFFASGILWFYSTTYKHQLVIGNLIVALLVGIVPMLVLLFEFPLLVNRYQLYVLATGVKFDYLTFWVVSYSGFAFSLTLIREIIKDIEDFEGDYVFGRQTIPIVWGTKVATWIVITLIAITILPIFYLLVFHLADKISFVYIVFFIIVPLIILAFGVFWAHNRKQYHFLSQLTKIIMLAGLMYCPLVNYIISSY
jgi:4-hydroxybenzoate polyprenyltransferase